MKDEVRKPIEIRERTVKYALRAIKLYQHLQECGPGEAKIMGRQYFRCATSIGANVEEAQSGESKADFIHKYGIAQKEARESLYWLTLLVESGLVLKSQVGPLMKETDEIVAIITKIIVNAKKSMKVED